jgi:hypothetical protein
MGFRDRNLLTKGWYSMISVYLAHCRYESRIKGEKCNWWQHSIHVAHNSDQWRVLWTYRWFVKLRNGGIYLEYLNLMSKEAAARKLVGNPDWGFSVLFPQLQGKCQGIIRKDGARPAFPKSVIFYYVCLILWLLCMFRSLYSVYCLCVNVSCTAATGCQPNCGYIYIYIYISVALYVR